MKSAASTFGSRLAEALELAGLNQRQLASKMGRAEPTISNWINVSGRYDRAEMLDQRRAALDSWDTWLAAIPHPGSTRKDVA